MTIRSPYLEWLYEQVVDPSDGRRTRTYWDLLWMLYTREFVWFIPNDDNRVADGMDLRTEYASKNPKTDLPHFRTCSVLEVLVGLSRRMDFMISEGTSVSWAWELVRNLGLANFADPMSPRRITRVEDILSDLIWRTYRPDGQGGFFPLAWPNEDQTKVEVWYQMCAFIDELYNPAFDD